MHSVYFVTNPKADDILRRLGQLMKECERVGLAWGMERWAKQALGEAGGQGSVEVQDCDALISLGGDGTLLQAAQLAVAFGKPLLGVNLGRLGFLTETSLDELDLSLLRENAFREEKRMLLQVEGKEGTSLALNDLVVNRGNYSRSIDLDVWVGQEPLGRYIADGFIVSTPTGSTGYSLSAGGPVVSPALDCMVLTPVCPHAMQNRPILVPPHEQVRIALHEQRDYHAAVSCDGRSLRELRAGETLAVTGSEKKLSFIRFRESEFFRLVRAKLNQT